MGAACEQTWKIFPSFEYFEHFSVVLLRQQNSGVKRSRVIFLFAIAEFLPAAFCSEFQTLAHLVTSEHGKLFHKKSLSLILNQSVSHPVARWTCPECGAGRGGEGSIRGAGAGTFFWALHGAPPPCPQPPGRAQGKLSTWPTSDGTLFLLLGKICVKHKNTHSSQICLDTSSGDPK